MVEASQLADKSVFGTGAGASVAIGQVHKAYDGWSCMQVLFISPLCTLITWLQLLGVAWKVVAYKYAIPCFELFGAE